MGMEVYSWWSRRIRPGRAVKGSFPNPSTVHTVTAFNPAGSTTATVTLTVRSIFQNWATDYGLDPATHGASGADSDGDSFSNALEYAFGTSPVAGEGSWSRPPRWRVSLLSSGCSGRTVLLATPCRRPPPFHHLGRLPRPWSKRARKAPRQVGTRKKITVPTSDRKFYRINAFFKGACNFRLNQSLLE